MATDDRRPTTDDRRPTPVCSDGSRGSSADGFRPSVVGPRSSVVDEEIPYVPRAYWAWVAYQLFHRIGWQFKMESTMVAGLVSFLTPSAMIMGTFTTLNTLGRTIMPLFVVGWIDARPRKRDAVLVFWLLATLAWAVAAAFLWTPAAHDRSLALWVFLAAYTTFMICLGCSSVAQGTLLGKVIPVTMRGQALSISHTISGPINVVAIYLVYALVHRGLFPAPRNYAFAFSITVFFFLLAAVAVWQVREPPSPPTGRRRGLRANLSYLSQSLARNPNLRLLVMVNLSTSLDGNILGLYTMYGRHSGAISDDTLVLATVCQVLFQSISSAALGRVVDRRGNRIVICSLLWVQAMSPLVAIACVGLPQLHGTLAYLAVYCLIGIRFPLFQLLVNYLLEVTPMDEHAMALGAMSTLMILTAPVSFLLGLLADVAGYSSVMLLAAAVMLVGAAFAPGLREPRDRPPHSTP